jgi:hypothetical protein
VERERGDDKRVPATVILPHRWFDADVSYLLDMTEALEFRTVRLVGYSSLIRLWKGSP